MSDLKNSDLPDDVKELFRVRQLVVEHADGVTGPGEMDCPVEGCDGMLRYRHFMHRGRPTIHAACSSGTCLSWME